MLRTAELADLLRGRDGELLDGFVSEAAIGQPFVSKTLNKCFLSFVLVEHGECKLLDRGQTACVMIGIRNERRKRETRYDGRYASYLLRRLAAGCRLHEFVRHVG